MNTQSSAHGGSPGADAGRPLRVRYFGTYRAQYNRNRFVIDGLRRNGAQVTECHERLWHGIEDRVSAVTGQWKQPAFWWRVARVYWRLLRQYMRMGGEYDVLVVGYPGQFDVYLARLLSWWHGKPLVWDILMSIYLVAVERDLAPRARTLVALLRLVERLACRLPDRLILDTAAYADWFHRVHGVPRARFRLAPIGADNHLFYPLDVGEHAQGDPFQVIYYGTYIPNHGVLTIVQAAALLQERRNIQFVLVGDGPDRAGAEQLARQLGLANVTFVDWAPKEKLRELIAAADLCLGVFGRTTQSLITVHNKIYEALAMAKPVVTGDGPAVRAVMTHGKHLFLCERQNPGALAAAILLLYSQPALCSRLAQEGRAHYLESFTIEQTGALFYAHLQECCGCDPKSLSSSPA